MKNEVLKYVVLIAYIAITIITSAGSLNYAAVSNEGIYAVGGGINLLLMGYIIYRVFKSRQLTK